MIRRLIPALFSLFIPGLGQLYKGETRRGFLLLSLPFILRVLFLVISSLNPRGFIAWAATFTCISAVLLHLFAACDAFRQREEDRNLLRVVGIGLLFGLLYWGGHKVVDNSFKLYSIPSDSMYPNLLTGDQIYGDLRKSARESLQRGNVILIKASDEEDTYLQRIIGLPGDKIEFRKGDLFLNDKKIELTKTSNPGIYSENLEGVSYLIKRPYGISYFSADPIVVPSGEFYVLGDSREDASDSRYWGTVPKKQILGRPLQIWFSVDEENQRLRGDRVGKTID